MDFWRALLEYGETPEDQVRYWNMYLAMRLPPSQKTAYKNAIGSPIDSPPDETDGVRAAGQRVDLKRFAKEHGGHPPIPDPSDPRRIPYMDFTGQHLEGVSFNRRILFNASFRDCTFDGTTKFRDVTFIGITWFNGATFEGVVRFDDAIFLNTAYFKKAVFKDIAVFDESIFKYAAYFQDAEFQPVDDPDNTTEPGTGFLNTKFEYEVRFDNSTFHGLVHFNDATFLEFAGFEGTTFTGDASFERASFSRQVGFPSAAFKKNRYLQQRTIQRRHIFQPNPIHAASSLFRDPASRRHRFRWCRVAQDRIVLCTRLVEGRMGVRSLVPNPVATHGN